MHEAATLLAGCLKQADRWGLSGASERTDSYGVRASFIPEWVAHQPDG